MRSLIILVLLSLPVSSFAQVPANQASSVVDSAQRAAKADLDVISAAIKKMVADPAHFDTCAAAILGFEQQYAQWFVDHAAQFRTWEQNYDHSVNEASAKLRELQRGTNPVLANPRPGQAAARAITFPMVISYFQELNLKVANCKGASNCLDVLMGLQENPEMTGLGVTHTQIVTAVQMMTTNLNASLKEASSSYQIGFDRSPDGTFNLYFLVNGTGQKLNLLNSQSTPQKDKWLFILAMNPKLDGFSTDGAARYVEMREKAKLCESTTQLLELASNSLPYYKVDKAVTSMKAIALSTIRYKLNPLETDLTDLVLLTDLDAKKGSGMQSRIQCSWHRSEGDPLIGYVYDNPSTTSILFKTNEACQKTVKDLQGKSVVVFRIDPRDHTILDYVIEK